MATRSHWLWQISLQIGKDVRDVKALREYFASQNLVCPDLRNNEQLEAVAHYLGVEEARKLPIDIKPKTRKKRALQKPFKSALSHEQIKTLKQQGLGVTAIANQAGISRQAVYGLLRR